MVENDIKTKVGQGSELSFEEFKAQVLNDYRLVTESREVSLLGRKEVLTGKAKFGIFGDGKELAQVALAKAVRNGDFRSGYYRDQTLMFATGVITMEQFFAQLYANPDVEAEPSSAGRQMNAHFATRSLDADGNWVDLTSRFNTSADASPTACQMARAVGLALASKVYRENVVEGSDKFSHNGSEVSFATIGDASTSEGLFWEAINAAGVQGIPMVTCVWDDGYGISVPKEYQTTKGSISEALSGFQVDDEGKGMAIYTVNGWDYAALIETFTKAVERVRETHIPAMFHVTEVTQPQGHSTSGSHERYKSAERLEWEKEYDCNLQFRKWILDNELATDDELTEIEEAAKKSVRAAQKSALQNFLEPIKNQMNYAGQLLDTLATESANGDAISAANEALQKTLEPLRKEVILALKKALRVTLGEDSAARDNVIGFLETLLQEGKQKFNSHLHSESLQAALKIEPIAAQYDDDAQQLNGYEILNQCFDNILARDSRVVAFGEDVGKIGDVNQAFAGLQDKYGVKRVFDTGIREATIMGQGMGLAMRGLRPIAEIQYLDYLIYGLQPLTDDLATLQYRTRGGQKAPLIIRTRGHRLEGIWHTGSPMGMIVNSLRGLQVCVPRNMVQSAGMYNTLLAADEPALVVECLNGYRLKEALPNNIGEFRVALGQPEVLQAGTDITLVTYGSCVRVAQEAIEMLKPFGVSVELVDVQTLLPFDVDHQIVESVKKTNRLVVLDEDVPGGASAYILQQILETQKGYFHLDAEPRTITAQPHRAAYGSDGDYFSKPSPDDVFETLYGLMHEADPTRFPKIY
jgi:pyruvate/2-oxoglutarate/acetoin dehydrogenase E1 component/TPP-dependent pyruvate/acetoin dehydrogenase alpha subunit